MLNLGIWIYHIDLLDVTSVEKFLEKFLEAPRAPTRHTWHGSTRWSRAARAARVVLFAGPRRTGFPAAGLRPNSGRFSNSLFSFVFHPFSSYFIPKWSPKHVESRYTTFKLQKQLNLTGKIQAKPAKLNPRDPDVQILPTKHSELPWDLTKLDVILF